MNFKTCLVGAVAFALVGCAGRPFTATTYGPNNLLGGYSEKLIEPGVWRVTGSGNGIAQRGFGQNVALYRAAELVEGAGFSHFQVLDQKGSTSMVGVGSPTSFAGETLTLTVRGVNDPAAPLVCRAKQADACATLNVAEVKARVEPQLTFRKNRAPSAR